MVTYPPEAAQRLAEHVRRRRSELGRTQIDAWKHGGPANGTLTAIENGEHRSFTSITLHRLDLGLDWPEGTAARLLLESEKQQVATQSTAELLDLLSQVVAELRCRVHPGSDDWGGLDPLSHRP